MKNTAEVKTPRPDLGALAEAERYKMVEDFAAFVIAKRLETEKQLFSTRSHLERVAPFAAVAIGKVQPLEDLDSEAVSVLVPCVVWEYASCALDLEELEGQLNLLNVFYP